MKIYDISWPITQGMTEYKDKKTVDIKQTRTIATQKMQEWQLSMNNHTGTHVDAPAHIFPTGATIDQIGLEPLIGQCQVLDLTACVEKITPDDLAPFALKSRTIVLLKTRNSFRALDKRFDYAFVYVDKNAAQYLVTQNIKTVGIDYLGIERDQPEHETHKLFLKNQTPIIEGLRLGDVPAGEYTLYCLPLLLKGLDSAPARAILISD